MNRYRICDNYSTSYNPKDMNDIYRKFQFQFSNMLNANEIARSLNDFEKFIFQILCLKSRFLFL